MNIKNYSTEEYIAVCARDHIFEVKSPETMQELVKERLLVREPGSGTRNILEELLLARGMGDKRFSSLYRSGKYAYNYRAFKKEIVEFHLCTKLR